MADTASLGEGTQVWHFVQIREKAVLGANCIVGRGVYVGTGVIIGDNCKLQNFALLYEPAVLGSGVFVGPGAVLTNDQYPRAVTPDGALKRSDDWAPVGVTIRDGVSIGAGAVCVAPVEIGAWAVVAAGAVVVSDVPAFALVAGVPGRHIGWVGQVGVPLVRLDASRWSCPRSGETYVEADRALTLASPTDA